MRLRKMAEAIQPVQRTLRELEDALFDLAKQSSGFSPTSLRIYKEVAIGLANLTDELVTGIMPAAYREMERQLLDAFGIVTDEVHDMPDGSMQLIITATNITGLQISYDVTLWVQEVLYRFLRGCTEDLSGVKLYVYDTDGKQLISVEVGIGGQQKE